MAITDEKVSGLPAGKSGPGKCEPGKTEPGKTEPGKTEHTPLSAAAGVEQAFRLLEGRWKLLILFHLFGGRRRRFSELEKDIAGISQKMLIQQLRQMENDGIVTRTVFPQVPPKVEYSLTEWGQSLCPALDALLTWADRRPGPPSSR